MATNATTIFQVHPECYDEDIHEAFIKHHKNPFGFNSLHFTTSVEESKALNDHPGPLIIISADGMCEAGRIQHHLIHNIQDPNTTILTVGYMAADTLGRRIRNREAEVKIHGQWFKRRAAVEEINAFSAHADYAEAARWLDSLDRSRLRRILLVHGEPKAQAAFQKYLTEKGYRAEIVRYGETYRLEEGKRAAMIYLTGFHAIEESIKSGKAAGPLLVAKPGPRARELAALAVEHKIRVDRVGTHDLDLLAPDHRGIALELEGSSLAGGGAADISLEEFIAALYSPGADRGWPAKDVLSLILDEITDPHNYGAILRSCDQFGVDLVITRHRRIAKHADVIARTSAGAASWVPTLETANLPRAVQDLKGAGFWIYGADMAGEPVYTKDLRGRTAIVLGGEGTGISRLLRESCDAMIAVPRRGSIDSLNVSVAAGVLLYEVIRQRFGAGHSF
jgi:predicted rRNA methylase